MAGSTASSFGAALGPGAHSRLSIDEFTKEALMMRVKRRLNSVDVIDGLTDLFILRGPPMFIRSDNGPEHEPYDRYVIKLHACAAALLQ